MSVMFEIDENSLPFVRTRHALLAVDLQSDFISPNATIPVTNPPNFVDNIVNLASKFRSFGSIIWIRTVFEASRLVNVDGNSESVITNAELPTHVGGDERLKVKERPSRKLIERYTKLVEIEAGSSEEAAAALQNEEDDHISETFLTLEPGRSPHVVSQASPGSNLSESVIGALDAKKDLIFQKTYYSAFKDERLVQTLRAKFVTEIYICGTLTNISVFATAMDAARHGYGITIVADCLGYRSKARHDEALRKLVEFTGCDIKSSVDLIEDINGIERAAQRVRQPTPRRNPRPQERSKGKDADLDNLMTNLNLRSDGPTAPRMNSAPTGQAKVVAAAETRGSSESPISREQAQELKLPTRTPSNEVKRERVRTKIKTRRRPSKSGAKDTGVAGEPSGSSSVEKSSSAATSGSSITTSQSSAKTSVLDKGDAEISRLSLESTTSLGVESAPTNPGKEKESEERGRALSQKLDDEVEKMAKLSVKEDSSSLCEGDTRIIHDLLDAEVAKGIFERVRDEVRWQKMSHQGGDVPRLVTVQGEIGEDGSIPIYRHPADESPPLLQFSPNVSQIRKRVEEKLGHPVNHVLIQFYRDGNDYISEHSDKTLDIVPKTFIANVSLGAQRTMVFRTKKPENSKEQSHQAVQPRQATRAPLPHNSICRMGLGTNMRWLHGIRQDKRLTSEKSAEELAFDGGRISLTFRQIGTFLSKDQSQIWGQGATSKFKAQAKTVINGDNAESEKMIRAFGKENHSSEFDWKEHYGEGFDVLHIENSQKLFLSGDKVADLRVKIMLAEYGIEWSEEKLSPPFHWKGGNSSKEAPPIPESLPVRFVDNDLSKSAIVGDLAIMLYLDAVYGPKPMKLNTDLARTFTRLQQSGELLKKWRDKQFSVKPFRKEMELWDALAAEGPFIAGEKISLADYAIWPLLEEIQREWEGFDGLRNLAAYHTRLKGSTAFAKALGVGDEKQAESQAEELSKIKEGTKPGQVKDSDGKVDDKKDEQKPDVKGKKTL